MKADSEPSSCMAINATVCLEAARMSLSKVNVSVVAWLSWAAYLLLDKSLNGPGVSKGCFDINPWVVEMHYVIYKYIKLYSIKGNLMSTMDGKP